MSIWNGTNRKRNWSVVPVWMMCDPDFATSQVEKEGQAAVATEPTTLVCQEPDRHPFFFFWRSEIVAQRQRTPATQPWAGRAHTGPATRAAEANEVSRSEWRWSTRHQMEALMHLAHHSAQCRVPVPLVLGPDASRFGPDQRSLAATKKRHVGSYGGRSGHGRSPAK